MSNDRIKSSFKISEETMDKSMLEQFTQSLDECGVIFTDHNNLNNNNHNSISFNIGELNSSKLNTLGANNETSIFLILVSIFKVLVNKISGIDKTLVLVPAENISKDDKMKFLPLLDEIKEGYTYKDLLINIKQNAITNVENDLLLTLETLETLETETLSELTRYIFTKESKSNVDLVNDLRANNKNELFISYTKIDEDFKITLNYTEAFFIENTVAILAERFNYLITTLLDDVTVSLEEINILSESESENLEGCNTHEVNNSVICKFEETVEKFPNKTAIKVMEDFQDIYDELELKDITKELIPKIENCCFKPNAHFIKKELTLPDGRIVYLLKNFKHSNIVVDKNILDLLELLDGKTNLKSIYNGIKDKASNFIITSISTNDLLEIVYGMDVTTNKFQIINFESLFKLVKSLYLGHIVELCGYEQEQTQVDTNGLLDLASNEDVAYEFSDYLFDIRKDIEKSEVLLLGDTPGMASMGTLYLASYLIRNGISAYCHFFDRSWTKEKLQNNIQKLIDITGVRVIGLSMKWFPHISRVFEMCKIIKSYAPEITTVVGGNSASYYYDRVIENQYVDFVVRGDGEVPLLKICKGEKNIPNVSYKENGKTIHNEVSYVIDENNSSDIYLTNLDDLLLSKYSLIFGTFYVHTQKGCDMPCFYCAGCRSGQLATFNRKKSYRREVEEVRKDIIEAIKYTTTFRFEFEDPNSLLVKYCEEIWGGIDLSSCFCDITHAYPPSDDFIRIVNKTFKYVFWNMDIASLSERHRIDLLKKKIVKPQANDKKLHHCFKEWDKYDNCEVKINTISGMPYFDLKDIEESEKLLEDLLSRYNSLSELHWGRLHAQPAAPVGEDAEAFNMVAHGVSYDDFLKYSTQNLENEIYPTIEDFYYPYVYYKDDVLNSQTTKHYGKMSHMVKSHSKKARRNLLLSKNFTYKEINDRVNQISRLIISKGVKKGDLVALEFTNSIEQIISILSVLKVGAFYLPIDPKHPEKVKQYLFKESQTRLLLTHKNNHSKHDNEEIYGKVESIIFIDKDTALGQENSNLGIDISGNDLAYVLFTSGTTGKPKGVMIKNESLANYTEWRIRNYNLDQNDSAIQPLTYAFDGFNSNTYSTLLSGGTLVMLDDTIRLDYEYLKQIIQQEQITNISLVPGMYQKILEFGNEETLKSLRFIVLAGEKCSDELKEMSCSISPNTKLINEYGPSECTVTATCNLDLINSQNANIGKPIDNVECNIVNSKGDLLPNNIIGEIAISGIGLSHGYFKKPDLTQKSFIQHYNRQNELMYKSGDLAKRLDDGSFEIIGRKDTQVKINGYRIELEEIQSVLRSNDLIEDAVVLVKSVAQTDTEAGKVNRLQAYIVSHQKLSISDLRSYLLKYLPAYLIPQYFIQVESIPLTNNGKVNSKKLLGINPNLETGVEFVKPRNVFEEEILNIWKNLLNVDKISIQDNFFDLGGTSLDIVTLNSQVREVVNENIPIEVHFEYPTIEKLTEFLNKRKSSFDWESDEQDEIDKSQEKAVNKLQNTINLIKNN